MKGQIINIEEVFDVRLPHQSYSSCDGYKVTTDEHTFMVLIGNGQSCCESWGYFNSIEHPLEFIGANLIEVRTTDTALNNKKIEDWMDDDGAYLDSGEVQFVDFVTTNGVFQLAVYNAHNGYYGHSIYLLEDTTILMDDCI